MYNKLLISYFFFLSPINTILALPLLFLSKIFTNKLVTFWYYSFGYSFTTILKYYYNVSFYVKNKYLLEEFTDNKYNGSHTLLIQNHLSQIEFIFLSALFSMKNKIPNKLLRMVSFYYIFIATPGIGILCYLADYIIITYNKIKNIISLNKCKIKDNELFYLCPEGSVFSTENKKITDKYCETNNIPIMKNCLFPRPGALEIIHKNNNIDTIYLLTTQYDTIKTTGKYHTLLNTKIPNKVYIKFDKYNITDDKIFDKTVELFRNIDNYLDKEIDESEYTLLPLNKLEIFSLLFHLFVFMCGVLALYNYNILFVYLLFVYIVYYIIVYFEIK